MAETEIAGAALTVTDVSMTFPGQKALDGVSLAVHAGEVHALLGENGSGKSTLIKILAGFHTPDPGSVVRVDGAPLTIAAPLESTRMGLRFVHQHLAIVTELNAIENIALEAGYAREWFIDWHEQERVTRELLGRLNVEMDIHRPLGECKPVEKSAVAIARALRAPEGTKVRVVVMDEPTASLPAAEVSRLFEVIRELTATGVAVIYVSHRLDEVFEISDRISVLRDGRLQGTAVTADVSREEVVDLIVGHRLAAKYERKVADDTVTSDEALAVRGLVAGNLTGLTFAARRGEIVGVCGIAGSGREDVARALVGAIPVDAGAVTVAGSPVEPLHPATARDSGLALCLSNTQPGSAVRDFTLRENLTLASLGRFTARFGLKRRAEAKDALSWVDRLDVRPRDPDRPYRLLSGGNQQKVILGRWLSADPVTLVLDDPTAGVDVGARQQIYRLIGEQANAGRAVVLCSSDLEDIVTTCHRALVLRDGQVVGELAGDEITEHALLLRSVGTAAPTPDPEGDR